MLPRGIGLSLPMKMVQRAMGALKDVSEGPRERVKQAVQEAISENQRALSIEFTVKDKNRRILALEDDKRKLNAEALAHRRATHQEIDALREALRTAYAEMELLRGGSSEEERQQPSDSSWVHTAAAVPTAADLASLREQLRSVEAACNARASEWELKASAWVSERRRAAAAVKEARAASAASSKRRFSSRRCRTACLRILARPLALFSSP